MPRPYPLLLLLFSVLLTGCAPAETIRPIYDPKSPTPADPRVEGKWTSPSVEDSDVNDREFLRWSVEPSNQTIVANDHPYSVTMISFGDNGSSDSKSSSSQYRVHLVPVNGMVLFDAELLHCSASGSEVHLADLPSGWVGGHIVGRAWIEDDFIRVGLLDSDWVRDHVPEDSWAEQHIGDAHISVLTAQSAEVRKLLLANADDPTLFGIELYLCRPGLPCGPRIMEDRLARRPNDPETLNRGAEYFERRGDYPRAIQLFRQIRAKNPENFAANVDLARALLLNREFPAARQVYLSARDAYLKSTQRAGADFLDDEIGLSYFLEGNYAQAAETYTRARAANMPRHNQILMMEYFSLVRLGRTADAEALLQKESAGIPGAWEGKFFLPDFPDREEYPPPKYRFEIAYVHTLLQAMHWSGSGEKDRAAAALRELVTIGRKNDTDYLLAQIEFERLQAGTRR